MMPGSLLAPGGEQFSSKLCYSLDTAGDSSPSLSSPPHNAASHVFTSFPVSVQAASACNCDYQVLPVSSTHPEFWFLLHLSSTVPVPVPVPSTLASLSKVLLMASTCSRSNPTVILPLLSPFPADRENAIQRREQKIVRLQHQKTSLISIRPEVRLHKDQFSSAAGDILYMLSRQKRRGKLYLPISTNTYMRLFKQSFFRGL